MILFFVFVLGLAVGSFLNVLIDRLPNDKSLLGRSHCDYCKKTLKPVDLIPVFSFVFLRGRCRYCRKSLSIQYPLIELLTGVLFVLTWTFFESQGYGVQICMVAIVATLIGLFFSDLKYQILPDEVQVALIVIASALLLLNGSTNGVFIERFVQGFVVMMPLLLLFLGTKGRGMGFGDVKLAFVLGYLNGIQGGYVILYLAFIVGGVFGLLALLLKRKKLKSKIAFGPFIIISAVVYIFLQEQIKQYLNTIF